MVFRNTIHIALGLLLIGSSGMYAGASWWSTGMGLLPKDAIPVAAAVGAFGGVVVGSQVDAPSWYELMHRYNGCELCCDRFAFNTLQKSWFGRKILAYYGITERSYSIEIALFAYGHVHTGYGSDIQKIKKAYAFYRNYVLTAKAYLYGCIGAGIGYGVSWLYSPYGAAAVAASLFAGAQDTVKAVETSNFHDIEGLVINLDMQECRFPYVESKELVARDLQNLETAEALAAKAASGLSKEAGCACVEYDKKRSYDIVCQHKSVPVRAAHKALLLSRQYRTEIKEAEAQRYREERLALERSNNTLRWMEVIAPAERRITVKHVV